MAIIFILLVGLSVLAGCGKTTTESQGNEQESTGDVKSEPQQTQSNSREEIPQPPALPEE